MLPGQAVTDWITLHIHLGRGRYEFDKPTRNSTFVEKLLIFFLEPQIVELGKELWTVEGSPHYNNNPGAHPGNTIDGLTDDGSVYASSSQDPFAWVQVDFGKVERVN